MIDAGKDALVYKRQENSTIEEIHRQKFFDRFPHFRDQRAFLYNLPNDFSNQSAYKSLFISVDCFGRTRHGHRIVWSSVSTPTNAGSDRNAYSVHCLTDTGRDAAACANARDAAELYHGQTRS
jgi:hypothetical protein